MARFYTSAVNGRGNTVGIGGRGSAGPVHLRGWDAGVRVEPEKWTDGAGKDVDVFAVYMTYGSRGAGHDVLLGRVHDTPDGPRFEASPVITDSDIDYKKYTKREVS